MTTPDIPPTDPCRLCAEKGRRLNGQPIIVKRWTPGAVGTVQVCAVCDVNPVTGPLSPWSAL
ncbi:hypothetical protein GCM10017673_14710 [Streptosporangium violaceochromogenes]|nr:hypothetical protein GCM10017673_14710 [Streptosporangium violaceochromogenes]